MKLLLMSDLHLEFSDLVLPPTLDFDVAVLAGDIICPGSKLPQWVQTQPALRRARAIVAVSGNHEYYDSVLQHEAAAMHMQARALGSPPLHLLQGGQIIIDGVRFLGCTLWTDFALRIDTARGPLSDPARGMAEAGRIMADYCTIAWLAAEAGSAGLAPRRLMPQDTLRMHLQERAWLERSLAQTFDGPTVVVTHHGPHRGSLASRFAGDWVSTGYLSELPAQFFEVPSLWIHGHTHSSHDYRVGQCRVMCNPRGYQLRDTAQPENTAFRSELVVTIGHDRRC